MNQFRVMAVRANGIRDAVEGTATLPFVAQILSINRFHADPSVSAFLDSTETLQADCFDVVLSDGTHKHKFLLAPSLNNLAHENLLPPLTLVRVQQYYTRLDERSVATPPALVLKQLEVLPNRPKTIFQRKKNAPVTWMHPSKKSNYEWLPSVGCRGYYVDLHTDAPLSSDPRSAIRTR